MLRYPTLSAERAHRASAIREHRADRVVGAQAGKEAGLRISMTRGAILVETMPCCISPEAAVMRTLGAGSGLTSDLSAVASIQSATSGFHDETCLVSAQSASVGLAAGNR
jgi:hypothetical protein